jgi:hypothetical protein
MKCWYHIDLFGHHVHIVADTYIHIYVFVLKLVDRAVWVHTLCINVLIGALRSMQNNGTRSNLIASSYVYTRTATSSTAGCTHTRTWLKGSTHGAESNSYSKMLVPAGQTSRPLSLLDKYYRALSI